MASFFLGRGREDHRARRLTALRRVLHHGLAPDEPREDLDFEPLQGDAVFRALLAR
ncbi:hypothetical protein P2318_34315 [Myxococcaceae bacterium GXIMD 01537]